MAAPAATKVAKGADRIAALPVELLVEVFSRVGSIKDLFRFAATCRRWLRLFADPAFLRELCPGAAGHGHGHRARLLGFFFRGQTKFVSHRKMMEARMTQHTSVSPPTFLPAPGSPLGRAERALTAFVSDDDGAFNYGEPLAARRGFVLMRLIPRASDMRGAAGAGHLLGLCNPTTGERHVLPLLDSCSFRRRCRCIMRYAIITSADDDYAIVDGKQPPSSPPGRLRFTFSRLLVITQEEGINRLYLPSYSAATRSWSAPTLCLNARRFCLANARSASAVVHHGAVHWLYIEHEPRTRAPRDDLSLYKLSAELRTSRGSLTKLPIRGGGSPLLCVGRDGKLSVACVYLIHMTVWSQQDDDGCGEEDDAPAAAWLRTQVIRMPMAAPNPNDPERKIYLYKRPRSLLHVIFRDTKKI